jgi:hypothetical protein
MGPCKSGHKVYARSQLIWVVTGWAILLLVASCVGGPPEFVPVDPLSPSQVSHQLFQDVLQQAVSNGRVDYPAIQDDRRFHDYLRQFDRIDPASLSSGQDRLALWINAYNAFAIKGILDGGSPAPYIGWYRYFKSRMYAVGGAGVTLYDLEHAILRREFKEPRVHFAIVCASVSCPALQSWVYEGASLDRQLDDVARAFINDPARNRFDRQRKIASLSKIFDWFEEDFAAAAGSVTLFLARYVEDAQLARDLRAGLYRIEYLEYDWSLNGTAPKENTHAGQP